MEQIDFRTSHNLVVSYPRAELIHRMVAFAIDFGLVVILLSFAFNLISVELIQWLIWIPFMLFYNLLSEIFFMGQSLGKKIMKIRVVSLDGKTPSLKSYLIRWAFRLIDIGGSSGILAMASIYSSNLGQRIGDLLAGTTVVQTRLSSSSILENISKLDEIKRDIKYTGVTRYNDEDMLTVKKLIQRYRENQTDENEELIIELAQKIMKDLNIINIKEGYTKFLMDVLEDYILLTR